MKITREAIDAKRPEIETYHGFRDYFGNKIIVKHNTWMNEFRLFAENKEYNKRKKQLAKIKAFSVVVPKLLEVIDVSQNTYNALVKMFPGVNRSTLQIHLATESEV